MALLTWDQLIAQTANAREGNPDDPYDMGGEVDPSQRQLAQTAKGATAPAMNRAALYYLGRPLENDADIVQLMNFGHNIDCVEKRK